MRKAMFSLLLLASSGCYGRASPTTCHARFERDHPNPYRYRWCMGEYRRRHGIATQEDWDLYYSRPSKLGVVAAAVAGAAVAQRATTPACRTVYCQSLGGQTTCRCLD